MNGSVGQLHKPLSRQRDSFEEPSAGWQRRRPLSIIGLHEFFLEASRGFCALFSAGAARMNKRLKLSLNSNRGRKRKVALSVASRQQERFFCQREPIVPVRLARRDTLRDAVLR